MNRHFLGQAILQIIGLCYATIKYQTIDNCPLVTKIDYSLPFDGEWYTVNGGTTKETSHSWEILPQRFAYDFIITDEEGKSFHGDQKNLNSYYCYGKEILAPADGIVVSIKNNFPDCRIMDNEQPDPDTPDIGGNRIIIKHSFNEYSTICHLMPGSITVQKGQTVKKGMVIAKCGNSGNTTEPHVHFQVQNTAHFYSCMGVQICFSAIQKRLYANYNMIDSRPLPKKELLKSTDLYRGLLVKNISN